MITVEITRFQASYEINSRFFSLSSGGSGTAGNWDRLTSLVDPFSHADGKCVESVVDRVTAEQALSQTNLASQTKLPKAPHP